MGGGGGGGGEMGGYGGGGWGGVGLGVEVWLTWNERYVSLSFMTMTATYG